MASVFGSSSGSRPRLARAPCEVRLALVAFVLLVVCRDGGCRSGGSGRWMYAEAAASDGHATAVLWGRSAALLDMGGDLVLRGWPVRRLGRRDLWGRSGWKSGRRPRMFGTTFVVCERSSRVVRATRRLNRAAARVRAGDVGAAAPESGVCVCCNVALGRVVGKGSLRVRFFGLVFLINWATLLGFRFGFPHKLDQLSSSIMQSQSTWPSDEVPSKNDGCLVLEHLLSRSVRGKQDPRWLLVYLPRTSTEL